MVAKRVAEQALRGLSYLHTLQIGYAGQVEQYNLEIASLIICRSTHSESSLYCFVSTAFA